VKGSQAHPDARHARGPDGAINSGLTSDWVA